MVLQKKIVVGIFLLLPIAIFAYLYFAFNGAIDSVTQRPSHRDMDKLLLPKEIVKRDDLYLGDMVSKYGSIIFADTSVLIPNSYSAVFKDTLFEDYIFDMDDAGYLINMSFTQSIRNHSTLKASIYYLYSVLKTMYGPCTTIARSKIQRHDEPADLVRMNWQVGKNLVELRFNIVRNFQAFEKKRDTLGLYKRAQLIELAFITNNKIDVYEEEQEIAIGELEKEMFLQ